MNTKSKRIAWKPKYNLKTKINNSGYTIKKSKGKSSYKCNNCKLIFKTIPGVKSHLRSCDTENTIEVTNENDITTTDISKNMSDINQEDGSSLNVEISDQNVDSTSKECSSELNSDALEKNNENQVKIEAKPDNMDVFININSEDYSSEQDIKDENIENMKMEEIYLEEEEPDLDYKCTYCEKTFVSDGKYYTHIAKHAANLNKSKSFQCDDCNRSYTTKGHLVRHSKSHHKDKKIYQCDLCSKRYHKYGQIMRHLAKHEPNNPYQCKICSKVLTTEKFLKYHMRLHTGEKPYQCQVCPQMFAFKHHLVKHMLKHDIAKPYKCELCSKSYDNVETYERHIGTHNSLIDTVYRCHECPSAFEDYLSLRQHRKIHDIQLHYCSMCGKKFIKEENLVEHMKGHV